MKHLIVIPAFNEAASLRDVVAAVSLLSESFEVVIVDDGSADATGQIADELAAAGAGRIHTIHLGENCGIGAAVQTGYLFAAGRPGYYRYVIQVDADGQHDARSIESLVEHCERCSLDLAVGSRFLSKIGCRSTLLRRFGIRFFAWLIRVLTGTHVTDPTSGLRCAGPGAWRSFANCYPEDFPEPESLFWCLRRGLRVGEVAVTMHARVNGRSSIRRLTTIYYPLKVTLAILVEWLRVGNLELAEP